MPSLCWRSSRYARWRPSSLQVDQKLKPTFKGRLKPTPADYQAQGAMFLPENARFSRLLALPGNADLGAELNGAMKAIAEANPELRGVLPTGYRGLPNKVLQELLRLLAPLKIDGDAYGLVFEYFMGQFASNYMQRAASIFTPASIVKLIVEVIEPYHGTILDPACGSGGMFVHSAEFVPMRHHKSPSNEISDLRRREDVRHAAPVPDEPRSPWSVRRNPRGQQLLR